MKQIATRVYRYRINPKSTDFEVLTALRAIGVKMDIAERITDGIPETVEVEQWLDILPAVLQNQRFRGATHRLDYPTITQNGKNLQALLNGISVSWDSVYSKLDLQWTGISIDQAENYSSIFTPAQAQEIFDYVKNNNLFQGNVSLGAYGNLSAIDYANYAMLGMDPHNLQPVGKNQKVPRFANAGYSSIVMHIDEPGAFEQFTKFYPTWEEQKIGFTLAFEHQKQTIYNKFYFIPFRIPLYQDPIYDYVANASWFGNMLARFNP